MRTNRKTKTSLLNLSVLSFFIIFCFTSELSIRKLKNVRFKTLMVRSSKCPMFDKKNHEDLCV